MFDFCVCVIAPITIPWKKLWSALSVSECLLFGGLLNILNI